MLFVLHSCLFCRNDCNVVFYEHVLLSCFSANLISFKMCGILVLSSLLHCLLMWQKNLGSVSSLSQQNQKANSKPPLPNSAASQFRKGAYHESLDFVHALCETYFGLVDVFPIEDRKCALCEVGSLVMSLWIFLLVALWFTLVFCCWYVMPICPVPCRDQFPCDWSSNWWR